MDLDKPLDKPDLQRRLRHYRHLHMLTHKQIAARIETVTQYAIDEATVGRFLKHLRGGELTCALFERFLQMEADKAARADADDKAPQPEAM